MDEREITESKRMACTDFLKDGERRLNRAIRETSLPQDYFVIERNQDSDIYRFSPGNIIEGDIIMDIFSYIRDIQGDPVIKIKDIIGIPFKDEDIPFILFRSGIRDFDMISNLVKRHSLRVDFAGEGSFSGSYERWQRDLNEAYKNDITRIDETISSMRELCIRIPGVAERSPLGTLSSGRRVIIAMGNRVASEDILPDIFAGIRTNAQVPFCQHGDRYKIFKGDSDELAPNYGIVVQEDPLEPNDVIALNAWRGQEAGGSSPNRANKSDFSISRISQDRDMLIVDISPSKDPNVMEERIIRTIGSPSLFSSRDAMRSIAFREERDIETVVKFYGITYSMTVFSEMVAIDSILSSLLFLGENKRTSSYPEIYLKGRDGEDRARASISPGTLLEGQEKVLRDGSRGEVGRGGEDYAQAIVISRDKESRDLFIDILSKSLSYYMERREEVTRSIEDMVPNFEEGLIAEGMTYPVGGIEDRSFVYSTTLLPNGEYDKTFEEKRHQMTRKLALNKKIAPELFISKYARAFQRRKQPIVISPREVEAWRDKRVKEGEEREVILFPQPEDLVDPDAPDAPPQHYYVCPNDDYPYFERVDNPLRNKDVFRVHIQCGKTKGPSSRIGRAAPPKSFSILETFKIARQGQYGKLDTLESKIISSFRGHSINKRVVREGTFLSPNSAIHCILSALDPNHNLLDPLEAERRAIVIRKNIPRRVSLNIVRQEQYSPRLLELREFLNEGESFFDPELWYRALEELFSCNIYIFDRREVSRNEDSLTRLLVPRHKQAYLHRHNYDRPTIIIIRHYGTEMNRLNIPQCELIVDLDVKKRKATRIFRGIIVGETMEGAFDHVSRELRWDTASDNSIERAVIPYISGIEDGYIELSNGERLSIERQFIDSNGKCRILEVTGPWYIGIPPHRPLNVTSFAPRRVEMPSIIPRGIAERPCPGPLRGSRGMRDIFMVKGERGGGDVMVNFLTRGERHGAIASALMRKREIDLIFQIIKYLFEIHGRRGFLRTILSDRDLEALNMSRNDPLIIPNIPRGREGYNIRSLRRILPLGTFREVLDELRIEIPDLFSPDGKLIVASGKMLAGIMYAIGKDVSPQGRVLERFYNSARDYSSQPKVEVVLLGGIDELEEWKRYNDVLSSRMPLRTRTTLQRMIVGNPGGLREPYVLQSGGENWLIQNVLDGDISRATSVVNRWKRDMINPGFHAPPEVEQDGNLPLYRVNGGGGITGETNESGLLRYHSGGYAGVLKLP